LGLMPKVQVQVNSNLNLIPQGGAATCAMIGTAQWGPIGEVTNITTFNEGLNTFKEDIAGTSLTMIKGLDLAYGNGAGTVQCVRVASASADYSELTLLSGSTSVVTISGAYKGEYGDNIMVTVTANTNNVAYRDVVITDGLVTENYDNNQAGYSTNEALVTDINANSSLVTATTISNVYLISALSQTNLSGGNNGTTGIVQADYTNLLDGVLYSEDFNILTVPGVTDDAIQTAIVGKLNTRASNDNAFAVYFSGIAVDETITTARARTTAGKRFALVAPNVKYTNRADGTEQTLDGSYLACAYAGVTALGWPELSGTHKTLSVAGLSVLASTGKEYYNNGDAESLLTAGIVPITKVSGAIQPIRAVTKHTSTTEVWYEQNIVDIVDYVQNQIIDVLNPFLGQPNLSRVRTVMEKNVDGILDQDKLDEVIAEYLPTVITEGASPDTVNVSITIKPTFLVNFINVTLTLDNTQ